MSSPAPSRPHPSTHALYRGSPARPVAPVPRPVAGQPAPAGHRPPGRYRYDRRSSAWWWSAEMFALQGVVPGQPPCTDSLLERQHPDDRPRVLAALTAACTTARPFTVRSRVLPPDGGQREVVLVGEPAMGEDGTVIAVEGMCVDLTHCSPPDTAGERVAALQTEIEQLRAAMASRAVIEQAKGILMLLTTCSDRVAFDLLTHMSSYTHRKVREVATEIVASAAEAARLPDDLCAILRDACPPAHALR